MANLIVRNIDDETALALKAQANRHGISAEAEHRRILREVLTRPKKKTFAEVISQMPDVGQDSDFERQPDNIQTDVFD